MLLMARTRESHAPGFTCGSLGRRAEGWFHTAAKEWPSSKAAGPVSRTWVSRHCVA
jgi:hypothetical protein